MWVRATLCVILLTSLVSWTIAIQLSNVHHSSTPLTTVDSTCSNEGDVMDVMVVGSGLSGGTAAFYLYKKGVHVMLADARDEAGGNLITKQVDGFQWEEGPNSFQPSPTILRFAKDLGILDELILADPTLPRFVYWADQLIALPGSLRGFLSFKLLSFRAKVGFALGLLGFVGRRPEKEESIREFTTRHFGEEIFERVVDPFVSGVYAGDPNKLGMKSALNKMYKLEDVGFGRGFLSGAFTRLKQIKKERQEKAHLNADLPKIPHGSLGSFRRGMQTIPLKMQEVLGDRLQLAHKLVKVTRQGNLWASTFDTPQGLKTVLSKALVLTAPSYVASDLLGTSSENDTAVLPAAAELANINYPPVASVTLAYPTSSFKMKPVGFGHLVPRSEQVRTLGTIWASSLFPESRAPAGFTVLTSFVGGAQDPAVAALSEEQLVAQVHSDTARILLTANAPPPKVLSVKMWSRAIPQYDIGHRDLLARVEASLESTPGLYLGGNYKTGVAIGDCIQFGIEAADKVHEYVKTH